MVLLWYCKTMTFYIGIDGGGSRCRARIRNAGGTQLSEADGGASNIYQDFDGAIATITATAQQAAARANLKLEELHAGLGLAGILTTVGIDRVQNLRLPFKSVAVNNDAYIACLGAFAGGDGGIVVTGTGSIGFALIESKPVMVGGWGFQVGDHGSGAWLGHHAVRRAALAIDGLLQPTKLIGEIQSRVGNARLDLSSWSEKAKPRDYAALAPLVFAAAASGDVVGMSIIVEGAAAISSLGRALLARGAGRLCLQGGLSKLYPAYLDADVMAALVEPRADPLDGAIMLAKRGQLRPEAMT
jgi:glucosamine kinase